MSTFNVSDITLAGAYAQALKSAQERAHTNAEPPLATGENRGVLKRLRNLVRRSAAAETRQASSQLTAHPV